MIIEELPTMKIEELPTMIIEELPTMIIEELPTIIIEELPTMKIEELPTFKIPEVVSEIVPELGTVVAPEVVVSVPAVEPSMPVVEPSFPASVEPSMPAVEPSVPAVEPSMPVVEPSVPAVEPSVPAVEPSVPAVEPSAAVSEEEDSTIKYHNMCPPHRPQATCDVHPCYEQKCAADPAALCIADYCGGCEAVWYSKPGVEVDCEEPKLIRGWGPGCPCSLINYLLNACHCYEREVEIEPTSLIGGELKTSLDDTLAEAGADPDCGAETLGRCKFDPCAFARCTAYPKAECKSVKCSGCQAWFYIDNELVDCAATEVAATEAGPGPDDLTMAKYIYNEKRGYLTCKDDTEVVVSNTKKNDGSQSWLFEDGFIQSVKYPGKVLTQQIVSGGIALVLKENKRSKMQLWKVDQDKSRNDRLYVARKTKKGDKNSYLDYYKQALTGYTETNKVNQRWSFQDQV